MDLATAATLAVLLTSFGLSFANQFEKTRMGAVLERYNRVGLWTNWTLFVDAPSDLRLWVRDKVDDEESAWRHIPYAPPRRWTDAVWNPELRSGFWLFYSVREHTQDAVEARKGAWGMLTSIRKSISYHALTNYIRHLPGQNQGRRFAIVFGTPEPDEAGWRLLYTSAMLPPLDQDGEADEAAPGG